ncbi:hypothetical protein [Chryseobacterium shigense]|uniref:Uncharacterized protein n=1 Tax=Chryseobacterium shigense TaxID=297244 RepID=A0A841NCC9_9FLAO|nr:hypothetical protein [Chryseobacterium shigense]MBB6369009.1 hypothetical protein [Chryseobacterium shigense]
MAQKIISDIDPGKLPKENLIIFYQDKFVRDPSDEEPCICCFERLAENPNYKGTDFLNKKNIKIIVEKLKKNVILKSILENKFIFNKSEIRHHTIFGKLIVLARKQQKGKYQEMYDGKIRNEERFYYFPYEHKKDLFLVRNYDSGNLETLYNYDTLELIFFNELENKVSVMFIYNEGRINDRENRLTKTYQYKSGDWEFFKNGE